MGDGAPMLALNKCYYLHTHTFIFSIVSLPLCLLVLPHLFFVSRSPLSVCLSVLDLSLTVSLSLSLFSLFVYSPSLSHRRCIFSLLPCLFLLVIVSLFPLALFSSLSTHPAQCLPATLHL